MRKVTAIAPGKINLYFSVGPLATDGFHSVASLYQAIDIFEEVSISTAIDAWSLSVTGSISENQLALVPTDESNLVFKATGLAAELAGIESVRPSNLEIVKRIPVAGGMAGGSADAAAALLAACEKFGVQVSRESLTNEAAALGSDVPFALLGGAAVGVGRGDKLQPVKLGCELHFVLITNDHGLKTPAVYAQLDEHREASGLNPRNMAEPQVPAELISAMEAGDFSSIAQLIHNDLESVARGMLPELDLTIAAAEKFGATRAFVSGSGPTVAALVENAQAALALAQKLSDANFAVHVCKTTTRGAELVGN
ncbi:MAG: 4-(cytidine 5'-diphospho)-2-C-methyl-D-erythritol kinase [Microbacteriaceae bacterium]